jgi:regulator of sigma E protease
MHALAFFSITQIGWIVLLVLGFGFVIFFHELGHFLAAKWVGIRVEQFAVGFGQAVLSWRKGVGFRIGNTQKDYQRLLEEQVDRKYKDELKFQDRSGELYQNALREAEKELGLGETEYRLNWIPLGGYVKMLGQDDLRPNSEADDPRSYNKKSIPARMLVVSAGVIMNVILAAIGYGLLFMIGFHVPPPWVGAVASGSPAAMTTTPDGKLRPLVVGDKILKFDGKPQEDFTKIGLNIALSAADTADPITVQHVDGKVEELRIIPRPDPNTRFLSIGIMAPHELRGADPKDLDEKALAEEKGLVTPDFFAVQPGQTITRINGDPVEPTQFWLLHDALQKSDGKPVQLELKDDATGATRTAELPPHFEPGFGGSQVNIAGLEPRPVISSIMPDSSAKGKLLPGDVVLAVTRGQGDTLYHPSHDQLRTELRAAGEQQQAVSLNVLHPGKIEPEWVKNLAVDSKIDGPKGHNRGLGVGLGYDESHPIVAAVANDSVAAAAHVPAGATITAVADTKVANWFEVQNALAQLKAGMPAEVSFTTDGGADHKSLVLNEDQLEQVQGVQRGSNAGLREYIVVRKASGPIQAIQWGVTETRDSIAQLYLTLRRMFSGTVAPDQLMGPLGIFSSGAKIAVRGGDWLLWFLSMISANLAVVNFLPIPIVDGGLFTFLILEKIQGKPLSPRAQAIAQYVGLAFLVGVFLFVTYNDILRAI